MDIIIVGMCKEGKSTIAEVIRRSLQHKGFSVRVEEEFSLDVEALPRPIRNLPDKINAIKCKQKINHTEFVVKTKQLPRRDYFKKEHHHVRKEK